MDQVLGLLEQGGGINVLVAVSQLVLAVAVAYWLFKPRGSRDELGRSLARYGNKVRRRRQRGQ